MKQRILPALLAAISAVLSAAAAPVTYSFSGVINYSYDLQQEKTVQKYMGETVVGSITFDFDNTAPIITNHANGTIVNNRNASGCTSYEAGKCVGANYPQANASVVTHYTVTGSFGTLDFTPFISGYTSASALQRHDRYDGSFTEEIAYRFDNLHGTTISGPSQSSSHMVHESAGFDFYSHRKTLFADVLDQGGAVTVANSWHSQFYLKESVSDRTCVHYVGCQSTYAPGAALQHSLGGTLTKFELLRAADVPEPMSVLLFGAGIAALAAARRRRA